MASLALMGKATTDTSAFTDQKKSLLENMTSLLEEDQEKPSVSGVVSVGIRDAKLLVRSVHGWRIVGVYLKVISRNVEKRTRYVTARGNKVEFKQRKFLPVAVIRNRAHAFNVLKISLMGITEDQGEHEIGNVMINLHDVVRLAPVANVFDFLKQSQVVAQVGLEVFFAYGTFGYGYSHQLQEDSKSPEDFLQFSMFPRIDPPEDRVDQDRRCLLPHAVRHPDFIPWTAKANFMPDMPDDAANGGDIPMNVSTWSQTAGTSLDASTLTGVPLSSSGDAAQTQSGGDPNNNNDNDNDNTLPRHFPYLSRELADLPVLIETWRTQKSRPERLAWLRQRLTQDADRSVRHDGLSSDSDYEPRLYTHLMRPLAAVRPEEAKIHAVQDAVQSEKDYAFETRTAQGVEVTDTMPEGIGALPSMSLVSAVMRFKQSSRRHATASSPVGENSNSHNNSHGSVTSSPAPTTPIPSGMPHPLSEFKGTLE